MGRDGRPTQDLGLKEDDVFEVFEWWAKPTAESVRRESLAAQNDFTFKLLFDF